MISQNQTSTPTPTDDPSSSDPSKDSSIRIRFILGNIDHPFAIKPSVAFDFGMRRMLYEHFRIPIAGLLYKGKYIGLDNTASGLGMVDMDPVYVIPTSVS